jgi:hypothetical protein
MANENHIQMALFFLVLFCYHLNIFMSSSWIDKEISVA